jgi:hypothetical protein
MLTLAYNTHALQLYNTLLTTGHALQLGVGR